MTGGSFAASGYSASCARGAWRSARNTAIRSPLPFCTARNPSNAASAASLAVCSGARKCANSSGQSGQARKDRLQRLIRRAGGFHHAAEIRRIEMARDEAECFERLQQWRQHGHDVVHHGLAHRARPCVQCSCGAFNSFARSVEVSTTSKVTPSW